MAHFSFGGNMKNNKNYILELILIFIVTILFNLFINGLTNDEVWNYGFAYNISNGLIPYKDFNMIITPLFPLIMSIFGRNIVVYHILNGFICVGIFYYMKKNNSRSYYVTYAILLFFALPNYSLVCLLLLYIILDLENRKANDYLIGIILGVTFLTKQNIGVYLFIASLFCNDFKKIFKRGIGFIIPCVSIFIYLVYNNSLYEFIDYCFLGISDFTGNFNYYYSCLLIFIFSFIYLLYKYIKTRNIKFIYLLSFQLMAYPLFDAYHVIIPFIPAFGYFLDELKLSKKIIQVSFVIFIICIFSYNFYLYSGKEYSYPNDSREFKYRKLDNNSIKSLENINYIINELDGRIFLISGYSYLIKLELGYSIDKYDLLCDGNLGHGGYLSIISEFDDICYNNKCSFVVDMDEFYKSNVSQYNIGILKYISSNYNFVNNFDSIYIYTNY